MKEEKEAQEQEESEEPEVEAVEEPEVEAVQESEVEEPGIEAVEEPKVEAVPEPGFGVDEEDRVSVGDPPAVEALEEPGIEAVQEPKVEAVLGPGAGAEQGVRVSEGERVEAERTGESGSEEGRQAGGEGDAQESLEDGIELDRMEVQRAAEAQEEVPEKTEDEEREPRVAEEGEAPRPGLLALLAAHWMWIMGGLLALLLVSAAFLLVLAPREDRVEVVAGSRMHVVTASLGGQHYVRFNLWGPFHDPKGEEALQRGLPKVKHDLILSGSSAEVARSIQENDLYSLEKHILEIVSDATAIPVAELDLKGLFVTRYSDEAELQSER
jgi:hypothetical protein